MYNRLLLLALLSTNFGLKRELKAVVERIPKDLKFWKDEIFDNEELTLGAALEYLDLHSYYHGKRIAYLHDLRQLGEIKYYDEYMKKYELEVIPQGKSDNSLLEKIWEKYHLDKCGERYAKGNLTS